MIDSLLTYLETMPDIHKVLWLALCLSGASVAELFALLGAPLAVYMLYRLVTVFCTYFTHSNISLPAKVDLWLSYVIVTPNAHKFHHHATMPWTNRNYGNIFSIWDRLFGTYVYDSTDKINYGVDTMDENRADSVWYQLSKPFHR